ncbi:MAG: hypothetical protein IJZ64_05535 [Ruminococcus sp.]|nr:hypothetical protein [Ruminococcus sp.]
MAVQENTNITTDFAKAQSIDFVTRFNGSIKKLQELLGITRRTPMGSGAIIKTYKNTVTLADGDVAEGEIIPLSKVENTLANTYELTYKKYRRAVTLEAIQRNGFDQAVIDADNALLKKIQSNVRSSFATFLSTGTGTATGSGFQASVANAWGKLQILFEDDAAGDVIVLANPMDISDYIGGANISTQQAFGMTYFKAFTDVSILTNASVPQGKFYATVSDNINIAYPLISGGEINKAFNFTTDESGLIGITHTSDNTRVNYETTILTGVTMFAERLDGVIVGTIGD